ncbi:MAG: DUF4870 domain-containing protein [Rubrobacter sp.]|nr:DUF4870 domain-containing protein [Rubrobacter sp.]
MTEDPNYGSPNYGTQEQPGGTALQSAGDERAWSALSHLSIFVNLVTGFLGPVASLVIWLVYREKSREVSFHALQSMWYQVAWLIILSAGWAITGVLMLVVIGFLLAPFMALLTIFPFVHSAYAAYRVGKGYEFRYPVIADMIDNR